ncbi:MULTISPECIES: pilus assembly protein [unclassified Fusibacter]|uniref:pilus assembly protein n=1 Tax=unclassified Fusibacter TaxID=2624464 RepID=UPI001010E5A5|nr:MULTISPECIES: pilus assembly protein [unclassified Fusibacter]MCK8059966.1 hypothetical protein [Fusibacter sp. A2]NPE22108.1 pilus assembly protein [Fusibacter sp. A1]RXV60886.1 pilus assembly protein [Fusibacter sp. A1]
MFGLRTVSLKAKSKGQGMVEYALLAVLIAMVIMIAIIVFGEELGNLYNNIRLDLNF